MCVCDSALARADVGIAIGSGTDIAVETAQVVLMKSDLSDVVTAIDLSQATLQRIHRNFTWACVYNVLSIPIAAGCLYPVLHVGLPPVLAAACMGLSSTSVIASSLLLKKYRKPVLVDGQEAFALGRPASAVLPKSLSKLLGAVGGARAPRADERSDASAAAHGAFGYGFSSLASFAPSSSFSYADEEEEEGEQAHRGDHSPFTPNMMLADVGLDMPASSSSFSSSSISSASSSSRGSNNSGRPVPRVSLPPEPRLHSPLLKQHASSSGPSAASPAESSPLDATSPVSNYAAPSVTIASASSSVARSSSSRS